MSVVRDPLRLADSLLTDVTAEVEALRHHATPPAGDLRRFNLHLAASADRLCDKLILARWNLQAAESQGTDVTLLAGCESLLRGRVNLFIADCWSDAHDASTGAVGGVEFLSDVQIIQERRSAGISALIETTRRSPDIKTRAAAWWLMGDAYAKNGATSIASRAYSTAQELNPAYASEAERKIQELKLRPT
jgi:hypothetical protein